MVEANPYMAPDSDVERENAEFGECPIFSFGTRIGRLRYLARVTVGAFGFGFLAAFVVGLAAAIGGGDGTAGVVGYLAMSVGSVALSLMFAAQRLHDLNMSGWVCLLLVIPLLNLLFALFLVFAAGTQGRNGYGLPPPPNTLGVKLAGLILPVVLVGGIIAAIAIPAYDDYTARVEAARQ